MVFSSSLFLLYFFPAFLIIYFALPTKFKNLFILLSSIVFYAWGAPDFIVFVLGSIAIDFYLVKWLFTSKGQKKLILTSISVIINIGLLAYFKYANFFVENVNVFLTSIGFNSIEWVKVALPIGISFFTFQKITYTIDVYRNVHAPLKKLTDYAMYILMFPQLIAGPIVRYNEIADQIEDRRRFESTDNRLTGFFRFVIGLSKKVLIANVLGEQVDFIFSLNENALTTQMAWLGILAYAFQIYYDFSGYSDMAIGIGRMIGFKFPENFNNPYISQSISEFWRRWHITLGAFMKNYLYIPLGGNRVSTARLYFNLWLVFAISGLWHGAAWTFVIWGIYHGLFLVLDRLFLLKFYRKIGKVPSVLITFLITLVGWVFFRAESISQAGFYIKKMFAGDFRDLDYFLDEKFYVILILASVFAFMAIFRKNERWQEKILSPLQSNRSIIIMTIWAVIFFVICLSFITSSGFNPFIYFRF
ncbi:MAG: MBOAT family protein [Bacteroidetes bacterium]|nr:MBOAT family protein [Bacteroidota bacterium]